MADLTEVQPGDLITSSAWNEMVRRVNGLQGTGGGAVTVPDLFSRLLGDAKAIVLLPGSQLNLSQVIDAFGIAIDANDVANAARRVLSQVPPGGSQVPAQTGVSLVVAAVASGGGGTTLPAVTSSSPASQQASGFVTINGANFDAPAGNNTVLFDGVKSTPDAGTTVALHVAVPLGIPGVPASAGSKANVQVIVQNRLGQQSPPQPMTVQSPPANLPPTITGINSVSGTLGQPVVIAGANFGTALGSAKVFFDNLPAGGVAPSALSATSITVTPPLSLAAGGPLSTKVYQVTVQINGVTSGAAGISLMVPP